MVDYYSTLAEVMLANVVAKDDITESTDQWNYLTKYNDNLTCLIAVGETDLTNCVTPSGDRESAIAKTCEYTDCAGNYNSNGDYDYTYFKIGLFGVDLEAFKDDCNTSYNCKLGDYYAFDGWAIGMLGKVYSETNYEALYDQGFCLFADKNCVILNETSGVYSITSFTSARKPSAIYPDL
jgi:hypothetical protein